MIEVENGSDSKQDHTQIDRQFDVFGQLNVASLARQGRQMNLDLITTGDVSGFDFTVAEINAA